MSDSLIVSFDAAVARVRLNRPKVRNALDVQLIRALTEMFEQLADRADIRVVVIEGEGPIFCGGADIQYMRDSIKPDFPNYEDALRLSDMFSAIDYCPVPTIAKVQGAALGGGAGLVAVSDIAIAEERTLFGFTEAKLGIVPAVISPFVLRKIGQSQARALFTTAERFSPERALRIGLIHEVVPQTQLESSVESKIQELLTSGPTAARLAKEIAKTVGTLPREEARTWTAQRISQQRVTPEAQEGLHAFLEKRRPSWQ